MQGQEEATTRVRTDENGSGGCNSIGKTSERRGCVRRCQIGRYGVKWCHIIPSLAALCREEEEEEEEGEGR